MRIEAYYSKETFRIYLRRYLILHSQSDPYSVPPISTGNNSEHLCDVICHRKSLNCVTTSCGVGTLWMAKPHPSLPQRTLVIKFYGSDKPLWGWETELQIETPLCAIKSPFKINRRRQSCKTRQAQGWQIKKSVIFNCTKTLLWIPQDYSNNNYSEESAKFNLTRTVLWCH
jgi:hypothetical protein